MIIRCIDVETLGLDPADGICEIGWTDVIDGRPGLPFAILVNPGKPIPPEMSAIHHIVDSDIAESGVAPEVAIAAASNGGTVATYCAHKASFEQSFLPQLKDASWICSWKVAIHLAPNAPSHSNQALRYWLKLAVDRATASPPHRAGPDSYVTAHLLARALAKLSPEEMIDISKSPVLLPKFTFGKLYGQPWEDADDGYLEWIVKTITDNEDAVYTAKFHLSARRAKRRERSPV